MNVPTVVKNYKTRSKTERFEIWNNRKKTDIEAPIFPYFYSYQNLEITGSIAKEKVKARALSDFQEHIFYKYSFNTRADLTSFRDKIKEDPLIEAETFEDNIPFILRNRIDNPDVFRSYKHTNELGFHSLDIEQETPPDKIFPTETERIISISYRNSTNGDIRSIYCSSQKSDDKPLLEKYIEQYKLRRPDVVVVYNKMYDLPMIINRCKIHKIGSKWMGHRASDAFVGGKHGVNIPGIVVYDVYDSVAADQSLNGEVTTRGLKEVSDYFGFKTDIPVIDFEQENSQSLIGTQRLIDYNKDDVRRLEYLFDIYWDAIEYQADDLGIPLNLATDLSITDLGLIVLGDIYREHGIIADGNNAQRFPEIFQRKKKAGEKNYQGALSFIQKNGFFYPVYKADFSSMYPSIMYEFNFSPDTCTLLEYQDYDKNGFKIIEKEHSFIYYIPDNQIKKTLVIESLKRKGFLSVAIKKFLDERSEYKKQYKKTGDKRYQSKSNNAKVKANGGIYGVMGNPTHPFGFAPAAVATTGIGRECAQLLIDVLNEIYPNSVIEVDTDGIYFDTKNIDEDKIQALFKQRIEEKFKKPLELSIDIDSYDKGFFHKAKNYVLQKGEKIIYHGVAMKSSSKSNIKRSLIKELAIAKLNEEPIDDIIKRYTENLLDFPLRDFAMQVSMGMHPNQYKNKKSIGYRMAQQAKEHFGVEPKIGNEYHYVKEKNDYVIYQLAKKENIDVDYYINDIYKVIAMFDSDIENPQKKKKKRNTKPTGVTEEKAIEDVFSDLF